MTLLFVYGTLKRGCSNHHFLAAQHFLGEARTEPGYTLYRITDYPGMVTDATAEGVSGEVWEVTPSALNEIDRLEGLDEGLYTRDPVRLEGGRWQCLTVETYMFRRPVEKSAHLGSIWVE